MILFIRALFIVIFTLAGYLYGLKTSVPWQGAAAGLFLGAVFLGIESRLDKVSFGSVLGGLVGLGIGILAAHLLLFPLTYVIADESRVPAFFILSAVLGYSGLIIGLNRGKTCPSPP